MRGISDVLRFMRTLKIEQVIPKKEHPEMRIVSTELKSNIALLKTTIGY